MSNEQLIVSVSGVRGKVGITLSAETAFEFGCAFATLLARAKGGGKTTVVIGRDSRPTGAMIQNATMAGLMSCGADVVDIAIATTPGVGLMTRLLEADGGMVVTSSHNPLPYNGLKFLQPIGSALRADDARALKALWETKDFDRAGHDETGTQTATGQTHTRHVDSVCDLIDTTAIAAKRFKVVVDCVNGAGCIVTPMLLGELGCEIVTLNGEPTGQFAHMPEPTVENLTDLCDAVKKHKAAVGFAQDPDADRLALVDENGVFIGEEYTLALCAAWVLRHRKGPVGANSSTSRMINDIAAAAGVDVARGPTGEANVVQAMQEAGAIFGGEGNGGVIEPRVVLVRDSLVGMAYVLNYLAETGKTLSELVAEIPSYTFIKTKLECPQGTAEQVIERVKRTLAGHDDVELDEADGLRVDLPDSWYSVRASNTEPIMRIFAEAPTAEEAESLIASVRTVADDILG